MAFKPNDKDHNSKVQESLKSTNVDKYHDKLKSTNANISSDGTIHVPKKKPIEKKKNYTFSLLPSVRKNIEK
ncbi:hypothetical protein EIM20_29340, partial [Pseudomonas aeruginosa]